jgi:hypothetical protein
MQYFITYVLGVQAPSGKKAEMGTILHKVMECLANVKKHIQDDNTSDIKDNVVGVLPANESLLYTDAFVKDIFNKAYQYYTSPTNTVHPYYPKDKETIWEWILQTLAFGKGMFDPRLSNIVAAEPFFDFVIDEPWAQYKYVLPDGNTIEGKLSIKGTIDLVTKVDENHYEIVDWKGLPLDTPIPTVGGWTTMEQISIGDTVFDQNGHQCKVIGKSTEKMKQCYTITFDDKSQVTCDEDHLWKLNTDSVINIQNLKIGDKISVTKPLVIDDVELPIHPYVLGAWLRDGKNRSGEISGIDSEIFEKIEQCGFNVGPDISCKNDSCSSRTIYGLTTKLKPLGVLHNKHIPDIYLRSSYNQRLELLRGLMDTDGNANPYRHQACFITTTPRLSDNIIELLLSLGQRPNCFEDNKETNFAKSCHYYQIQFRPVDINPFYITRKREQIKSEWGNGVSNIRRVIKIEKNIIQPTQCIMVDSPDNTYLCTKRMIPTHNTGECKNWGTGAEKDYKDFCVDPQLRFYHLALHKLFPQVEYFTMTINYVRTAGAFTVAYDNSDCKAMLEDLRQRFHIIQQCKSPKPKSRQCNHWFCQRVCWYGKTPHPKNPSQNMCQYSQEQLHKHGLNQTMKNEMCSTFNHEHYSNPGE